MSYRPNSDGGVIAYVNRHVPQVTWNDLSEEECNHLLAMIRHYSREYYSRKNNRPKVNLDAEDRMFHHRHMLEEMIRMSRYSGGFMRLEAIRPREIIVDELRSIDFSAIEERVIDVLSSKADIFRKMYGGEPGIIEESHHIKPEDIWIKTPRIEQPKIGAGKNPFAEHTIRRMKGRRN